MTEDRDPRLVDVLQQAQTYGFLGKGSVEDHIDHARSQAAVAFGQEGPDGSLQCLDLGSGGGVPGLVIAMDHPTISFTLLDRSDRKCEFLAEEVAGLQLSASVKVVCMDAADAAHEDSHRQNYDYVFSRLFGSPALVAECAAGLLIPGGELIVSEPPASDTERWPPEPLRALGIELVQITDTSPHFAVLRKVDLCPDDRPRPWSKMVKQPLY